MTINALNVFSFVVYVKMCDFLSRFYFLDDAKNLKSSSPISHQIEISIYARLFTHGDRA